MLTSTALGPAASAESAMGRVGFIGQHGLWTESQAAAANELTRRLEGLRTVRVAWADQHGLVRGKALPVDVFRSVLRNGMRANTGPAIMDSGSAIAFNPFMPGGGFGSLQMEGCPDVVCVPDPATFRTLPWAPGTGWVLCDMYFQDGTPFPYSSRRVLQEAVAGLDARNLDSLIGVELEWHLTKLVDPRLSPSSLGGPGAPGEPPEVESVTAGYQYQSEINGDLLEPILSGAPGPAARRGAAAADDRGRVGPVADGVHAAPAAGPRGGRRGAAVPQRRPADLPPSRLPRDVHVPPRPAGLLLLGLAPAPVARRPRDGRQRLRRHRRLDAHAARPRLRRRPARARPRGVGLRDADGQRLQALPAVLAGARPGRLGRGEPRLDDPHRGRRGRPVDAPREPRGRAGRELLPLHRVADPGRPRRHRPRAGPGRARPTTRTSPRRRRCPARSARPSTCSTARRSTARRWATTSSTTSSA